MIEYLQEHCFKRGEGWNGCGGPHRWEVRVSNMPKAILVMSAWLSVRSKRSPRSARRAATTAGRTKRRSRDSSSSNAAKASRSASGSCLLCP